MDSLDPATPGEPVEMPMPQAPAPSEPLVYEETPVIEPINDGTPPRQVEPEQPQPIAHTPEPVPAQPVPPTPQYKKPSGVFGMVKMLIFLILLFGVGIGASFLLRPYITGGFPKLPSLGLSLLATPTLTPLPSPTPASLYANWKTYQITSGSSKQMVSGISYMLPQDILPPICDGGNCASSGTYLPGGTRFTVDARGVGQLLPDFRGKILTDQGGREFIMKDTTVAGHPAKEFTGIFTGTTSGGYAFSQMRGVMVEVSDTISVEFNHFTPTLVNADFAADDILFNNILQSVQIASQASTPKVSPTPGTSVQPSSQSATTP